METLFTVEVERDETGATVAVTLRDRDRVVISTVTRTFTPDDADETMTWVQSTTTTAALAAVLSGAV